MKTDIRKSPFRILAIIFASLVLLSIVGFAIIRPYNQTLDFDKNSKDLFHNFKLYKGKVYTSIPSDGYLPIEGADPKTISPFNKDSYYDQHISLDKNNVYCGNKIIPNMNPKTFRAIGNNYYTDGKHTYYCGRMTINDNEPAPLNFLWQQIKYDLFGGKKPQRWSYPIRPLAEPQTPYQSLQNYHLASNGKLSYYKGKLMQGAEPKRLHFLRERAYDPNEEDRESFVYSSDGKNIYYKAERLEITPTDSIYTMEYLPDYYLIEGISGMVYVNNQAFDKKFAPYSLLTSYENHTYQQLFLSKEGIYFYETMTKKIVRAGDNIFYNKAYKEIAPYIFYNGQETLFLNAYEIWHSGRRYRHLISRNTAICRLEHLAPNLEWVKLGQFYRHGSVWQYGTDYYYFDNYGDGQAIKSAIYKIRDKKTVEVLLSDGLKGGSRFIRKLIKEKRLLLPKYSKLLNAETNYEELTTQIYMRSPYIALGFIFICMLIGVIFRHFKAKKQDDYTSSL